MTDTSRPLERSGRRGRRRSVQKYEAFVQVLTGEMTVVECADHWGVDRSTIRAREVAKRGALDAVVSSRDALGRRRPARDEAAPGRGLHRALGVTAGVPPRVEAGTKAALRRRRRRRGGLETRLLGSSLTGAGAAARPMTALRAVRRHMPSPQQSAGRSWSCSSAGATSTAATASSRTAAPTRTWCGCRRRRCIAFSAQGLVLRRRPTAPPAGSNATRSGSMT